MDHNARGFILDKNKMVGFIREAGVKRRVTAHNAPDETKVQLKPSVRC